MKKFLSLGLMLASLNAFSQSYLILNNGVTLTTDKAGFVYDFGHFRLPYKVTLSGQQYLVEDKKLSTVDSNGLLYEKSLKGDKIEKIKGKGGNFFINDENHLFVIDSKGYFFEYDKDDKIFKKAIVLGGNWFLVKPEDKKPGIDLYTVNDKGNYFKLNVPGLNNADIIQCFGNYFQTKDGMIYTVSKDGFVFPKPDIKTGKVAKSGGNYFIDSNGLLFTVSEEGFLLLPELPATIKISEIKRFGANYMVDSEGRMFVVDSKGNLFERTLNHDLRNAKILSL
jgi:hypothetical protein